LIGGLLGLLKLFSIVSLYNQRKFEKILRDSLIDKKKDEEEGNSENSLINSVEHNINRTSDSLLPPLLHNN
jgi:hypothetical protein